MKDVRLGNLRKANLTMADAIVIRDIAQDLCEILENIYSIIDGTFYFDL